MSFVERLIEIDFSYGTGPKGDGAPTTATIKGCRVSLQAIIRGGVGMGQCSGRIYGMSLSLMNQLSRVGKLPAIYRPNVMTVRAGDDKTGMAQIYQGTILKAFPDMASAPEVSFLFSASAGMIEQLKPSPPSSFSGSVDAAVILSNLAQQMKVQFENNGVSVQLSNAYFFGSPRTQSKQVVEAAKIEWNGIENGILAIWPKGSSRKSKSIPLISAETGMIGYPSYTENGIFVKSIFLPTIRFGQLVQVKSDLEPANGKWKAINLTHEVESKLPGGRWSTSLSLVSPAIFGE